MKINVLDLLARSATSKGQVQDGKAEPNFSPALRQCLVASGPLLLTITLGMTSGYSAVLLPQLQNPNSTFFVDQNEASWIASMAALPMALGCVIGGVAMEKFGRRAAHILTAIPCLTGWLAIAFAPSTAVILAGRFFTGICAGLLGPVTGVYIGETSEPKFRGLLLAGISLAIAVGLFLVHLLGTFFHWQTTALISCLFPVFSLVLLATVPESPVWLVRKGKVERGQKNFFWCRGYSEEAKNELGVIVERHSKTDEVVALRDKLKGLLRVEFLKPLGVIVVFIVSNQWAGVNAITFYSVSIMKKTLGTGLDEYLAMLIIDVIRVVMSVVACVAMKRMGRRPLAIISGIGTFTSLFILSGFSYLVTVKPEYSQYTSIPMTSLVSYISFVSIGYVPLPWAMIGEVFPTLNRNVGSSISSMMAFTALFSVVKTSPAMFEGLEAYGAFLVYGSVAFLGTVFIFAFLPETKDKPLYEIEDQFRKNST